VNSSILGSFRISQEFSNKFAEGSGDFNPLHVDPVLARRYQYGSTVIHGVNGLLKALEIVTSAYPRPVFIESIIVRFNQPIRHDDAVDVQCKQLKSGATRIELIVSNRKAQIIDVCFSDDDTSMPDISISYQDKSSSGCMARELDFKHSLDIDDEIDLIWNADLMTDLFPALNIPVFQAATLLGLTKIVGMLCPGFHSVFGGIKMSFNKNAEQTDPVLKYKVTKSDERFSLITISVSNSLAQGEIEALFRPKPVQQASVNAIKPLVQTNQFETQRALIIGGSRGVGEITAKIISAGGGQTVISYAKGKTDALRVIEDITADSGQCGMINYDVLSPSDAVLNCFAGDMITHIYYFASPRIEKTDDLVWNEKTFSKFSEYYLSGLARLLDVFIKNPIYKKNGITLFIPSTIFLDQPQKDFSEYIAAKGAVEAFIRQFTFKYPSWTAMLPRLPRMLTDQTSGVADDEPLYAVKLMLEAITGRERFSG